jgi:predicted NAD/FAD-binding protein
MSTLAIVGTGIAGLGCAHFLHRAFDLTIFEQNDHVGGHSNTVTAREPGTGRELPIDTGFMVFNRVTYPLLCRLFDDLRVPVKRTDMSFSVRDHATGLEWCGSSFNHLFAQRRNIFNLRFLRMLRQVSRFNAEAIAALDDPATAQLTLADYVRQRGYGTDFFELYLAPMSSAVWSTPPEEMLRFPAATLLRFFHNHGFLGLHTQHPWWTVDGGAREYVRRLTVPWRDCIRPGDRVVRVTRQATHATITTVTGRVQRFDHVILATHADQALALLSDPTPQERRTLGAFSYQSNTATLHTDARVMPRTRRAWASWNYELGREPNGQSSPATHYWMNRLQGVSDRENYFVSINRPEHIAPSSILRRIACRHPCFDLGAVRAQRDLPHLNDRARHTTETYFAGSYFRYGFHEDAFMSAVSLSGLLLGRDPWQSATRHDRREVELTLPA